MTGERSSARLTASVKLNQGFGMQSLIKASLAEKMSASYREVRIAVNF